ncbi:MAG: L-cysteine:1D-myo-inositol 2-amino-2-deoxy-alpha-D-glucopyranoside ligase [Verrucomicrobiales bacterium]|jgi:L-cysteine:1D-myo-inositol 2-amino-2-deoxy-alpha-D-glucopyranoside ligase
MVVPFEPGPIVRLYVCGITPYDSTHLGHANTYLTYDLLVRRLEDLGHEVHMVRNVTDVDDSILPKARELGIDFLELAATEMKRFNADMEALNTRPAAAEPRVTESIEPIIDLVQRLQDQGHTYTVDGITYFDVATAPRFGRLSGYAEDTMLAFAAERGGTPTDLRQRNPLDFILWQPSADDEPTWDSPFGPGRPGWHIECSAMSWHHFGETLDLHGGGRDLIFPHHECERVQSELGYGHTFARHWMHAGMVAYQGTKMSKSLGNLVFVNELIKSHAPQAVRLALMGHHYRDDWEWFDGDIDDGQARYERIVEAVAIGSGPSPAPALAQIREALDDDLNAPAARDALDGLAQGILSGAGDDPTSGVGLKEAAALLGVSIGS